MKPLERWLAEMDDANGHGERLRAIDIAEAALGEWPDAVPVKHALVLALARAGAIQQACARYRALGLDRPLGPEVAALGARLAKDTAMSAPRAARPAALRDAAARYNAIFADTNDYYPGINAAALCFLSGDAAQAKELARAVLEACRAARAANGPGYYAFATEAEAFLLLGCRDEAAGALAAAAMYSNNNLAQLATTRKQLALICAMTGIDAGILGVLRVPTVVHFTGHHIGRRFAPEREASVTQRIASTLAARNASIGYGSLAGGADIIAAETLLRAGGELNVVLPFEVEEFRRISVAPSGAEWLPRFDRCLAAARSVEFATTDQYLGDTSLFGYSSQLAMGLALLRARFLGGEARQLAVWDGNEPNGEVDDHGTAADISYWQANGHQTDVVTPGTVADAAPRVAAKPEPTAGARRLVRALFFADIAGFSNLREAQLPVFVREVLGRFAAVLDRYGERILYRNSWGDGLFVVTQDAETAAHCALDLHAAIGAVEPGAHGLSGYTGLRLGAHVGPVVQVHDPVLGRATFLGVHVSRTARIEPVTPVGAVYVTEAFAANIIMQADEDFVCEYVGEMPSAKNYERMRMYSLRRREGA